MSYFENFDVLVAPLHPLGVIIGSILCGAIGGAIIAGKEGKRVGMWAARGAALLSLCIFVGGHIGSLVKDERGGALPGLVIGGIIGCIGIVIFIIASRE